MRWIWLTVEYKKVTNKGKKRPWWSGWLIANETQVWLSCRCAANLRVGEIRSQGFRPLAEKNVKKQNQTWKDQSKTKSFLYVGGKLNNRNILV